MARLETVLLHNIKSAGLRAAQHRIHAKRSVVDVLTPSVHTTHETTSGRGDLSDLNHSHQAAQLSSQAKVGPRREVWQQKCEVVKLPGIDVGLERHTVLVKAHVIRGHPWRCWEMEALISTFVGALDFPPLRLRELEQSLKACALLVHYLEMCSLQLFPFHDDITRHLLLYCLLHAKPVALTLATLLVGRVVCCALESKRFGTCTNMPFG